ncbi:LOW QUALITY PROTEIN: hypothetical protein HZS_3074 [Henneguya salminicola]|nr:LOW QUALITY PROTEIN: hypothetical protein HZS_3074 [Henneguya salminicola]
MHPVVNYSKEFILIILRVDGILSSYPLLVLIPKKHLKDGYFAEYKFRKKSKLLFFKIFLEG